MPQISAARASLLFDSMISNGCVLRVILHCAGEWCVSQGDYQNLGALNRTEFDDLATVNANKQHCNRLTSATCFRSRESMGKVFTQLQANATKAAAAQTPVQVRKALMTDPFKSGQHEMCSAAAGL